MDEKRGAKKQIGHTTSYSHSLFMLFLLFSFIHFCFALRDVRWNGLKEMSYIIFFLSLMFLCKELYSTPLISSSYLLSMHVNILCHKIPIHIKWMLTLCRCMYVYIVLVHGSFSHVHREGERVTFTQKAKQNSNVPNGWNEQTRTLLFLRFR